VVPELWDKKEEPIMARKSSLYSIYNGVLKNSVATRWHERGVRDAETKKWTLIDKIIVVMMSDIMYYTDKKTGEKRKKFVGQINYVPIAFDEDGEGPRLSQMGDFAYDGEICDAEIDGKVVRVLAKPDPASKKITVFVREGWNPFRGYGKNFAKYLPNVVRDFQERGGKNLGAIGAFKFGGNSAELKEASTDADQERELMGRSREDDAFGGRVVYFGAFDLEPGEYLLGRTRTNEMWRVDNVDGEGVLANRHHAEALRPVYDVREKQRVEKAKAARIAKYQAEQVEKRAQRKHASALEAPKPEFIDDQVVESIPEGEDTGTLQEA
jgi:hypothetical protein